MGAAENHENKILKRVRDVGEKNPKREKFPAYRQAGRLASYQNLPLIFWSIDLYLQPGWNLGIRELKFQPDGAVAQSAVVFQQDEGVLEKQGPAKGRDRAG